MPFVTPSIEGAAIGLRKAFWYNMPDTASITPQTTNLNTCKNVNMTSPYIGMRSIVSLRSFWALTGSPKLVNVIWNHAP